MVHPSHQQAPRLPSPPPRSAGPSVPRPSTGSRPSTAASFVGRSPTAPRWTSVAWQFQGDVSRELWLTIRGFSNSRTIKTWLASRIALTRPTLQPRSSVRCSDSTTDAQLPWPSTSSPPTTAFTSTRYRAIRPLTPPDFRQPSLALLNHRGYGACLLVTPSPVYSTRSDSPGDALILVDRLLISPHGFFPSTSLDRLDLAGHIDLKRESGRTVQRAILKHSICRSAITTGYCARAGAHPCIDQQLFASAGRIVDGTVPAPDR